MQHANVRSLAVLSFCLLSAIVACSGQSGSQTIPAGSAGRPAMRAFAAPTFPSSIYTAGPADVPIAGAKIPKPFNPSSPLPSLGRTPLHPSARRFEIPREFFMRRASVATAPPGDHEADGTFMFADSQDDPPPYNAIFSVQTAYEASQNPIPYPLGASGSETIFVPTTHMAWGSCLENGTQYQDADPPNGSTSSFYVFDFCTNPAVFLAWYDIDSAFVTNYVRYLNRGPGSVRAQSYVEESFTPDRHPNAKSTWYSLLYNFGAHRYDVMGSDKLHTGVPFSHGAFGWSVAEPYAAAGPCPQIAPAVLNKLELHDTKGSGWKPVTPSLAAGAYSFIGEEGGSSNSCFNGSPSGSPTLLFSLLEPNYSWTTESPRQVSDAMRLTRRAATDEHPPRIPVRSVVVSGRIVRMR